MKMIEFCDNCKDRRVAKLAVERLRDCEGVLEDPSETHWQMIINGLLHRVRETLAEVEA